MREMGWQQVWPQAVKKVLDMKDLRITAAHLADQDVFNTVLMLNPTYAPLRALLTQQSALMRLPCEWNLQLSDNSIAQDQCDMAAAAVVHWNSPKKLQASLAAAMAEEHELTTCRSIYLSSPDFSAWTKSSRRWTVTYCATLQQS